MSEVCDGFGRLYRGPSVGAGEGGGGGAGDLEVVGGVDVLAVIAVVFLCRVYSFVNFFCKNVWRDIG